jgi:hypothetical protein
MDNYETELRRRIDEVLHYIWDPIDVRGEPHAREVELEKHQWLT